MKYKTYAICLKCFTKEHPNKEPVTMNDRIVEKCCMCGDGTASGIYIRKGTEEVNYPS